MQPLPLQIPGFMELAVILLIFLILAVPVALLVGLVLVLRRRSEDSQSKGETIEELETRVSKLETKIEDRQRDVEE